MNGPFLPPLGGDGSSVGVFAVADGVDADDESLGDAEQEHQQQDQVEF